MNVSPFIHTLRYLKWRQIFGQASRRLLPFRHSPSRQLLNRSTPFSGINSSFEPSSKALLPPNQGRNNAKALEAGRFEFLNQANDLGFPPTWLPPFQVSKLWIYNLHYFDWVHSLSFAAARQVTLDWIQKNPPNPGQPSWDPYPISLRGLNWTLYFFVTNSSETLNDTAFAQSLWQSLEQQLSHLSQNLETHLLGNHLFENAATLAFAGTVLNGATAARWKRIGVGELRNEIPEQIMPDGMHFENSPMYHLRITYVLYLLYATGDSALTALTTEPLRRSRQAMRQIIHPDQQIALLNDSAFEIYHPPEVLMKAISKALSDSDSRQGPPPEDSSELGPWSLINAGYYGARDQSGNYIICDAGPIGPDYIPGHAHADFFTFELSLNGCRVIVDAGNFDYIESTERAYCRSTRAHNTVEVAEQDQCELWGAFRVGRRGYPKAVQFERKGTGFRLSANHTGYNRPPFHATHKRIFEINDAFRIKIQDEITAPSPIQIKSFIHLAPQCDIIEHGENHALVRYPKGSFSIHFSGGGQLKAQSSDYYPEFGIRQTRQTLCFSIKGQSTTCAYTITPQESPRTGPSHA